MRTNFSANRKLWAVRLVGLGIFVVVCVLLYRGFWYLADPSGLNPYADRMHTACCEDNTKAVQAMLRQGADVNAPIWEDTAALLWAVRTEHPATVKVLLAAGADVNAQSGHGKPLNWCYGTDPNSKKIMAMLEQAGAKD